MSFLDNLSKKVGDAAKTAAKKSGDLVEITKYNMAINSEEDKIKAVNIEIGKLVYKMYQAGETFSPELMDKCKEISGVEENITSIREKISQLKNSNNEETEPQHQPTPQYEADSSPVPQHQPAQAVPQYIPSSEPAQVQSSTEPQPVQAVKPRFCPSCGSPAASDSKFCQSCGAKL